MSTTNSISHFFSQFSLCMRKFAFVMSSVTKDFAEESLRVFECTTEKADKLFIFTMLFNTISIPKQTISVTSGNLLLSFLDNTHYRFVRKKKYKNTMPRFRSVHFMTYIFTLKKNIK